MKQEKVVIAKMLQEREEEIKKLQNQAPTIVKEMDEKMKEEFDLKI